MSAQRLFDVGPPTPNELAAAKRSRPQLALFDADAENDPVVEGDEWIEAANELADGWLETEVR